jgi:hypothetical protein
MTTVKVLFLGTVGEDLAGETKAIEAERAHRLVQMGYARLLEHSPEETAARPRAQDRGVKPERRG